MNDEPQARTVHPSSFILHRLSFLGGHMASEIKLPELGENLTGGDVLDVKVAAGDTVAQGQTLLEVEAEKSTVEVPSPVAGRVQEMRVKKGDAIQVGQTLCLIDEGDGKGEEPKTAPVREDPAAQAEPESARKPSGNGRGAEAKKEPPARREEPKEAEGDGRAREAEPPVQPAPTSPKAVPAGPATRRLARELGVDLAQVRGSAPGGRVTEEDVKAHVRDVAAGTAGRGGGGMHAPPLPDFTRWGEVERRPLDGVRRKTAEQMSLAWSLVPHVTQHDLADVTGLEAFRKQQGDRGPKLTVTAFGLKAAAIVLRQYPQFNSSLDTAAGQLVVKRYYHIGVAVDTERGLLVPVIRDVDRKSIYDLAQELTDVAERARQKKIAVEEMRGGTFTITNLGGIGGTAFTPIVNYPEVAILGLSRSRLQPVVHDGQVTPRLLLPLSLSYDHRVIDGADAARFTRRLAELLENPLQMLLHA
jgi:pyruvate dehydrogenase E2 component (dihydrolipoamide acetyltransferase)